MGWRARIGVIYPANGLLDDELWALVPEGVTPYITRQEVPMEDATLSMVLRVAESQGIEEGARCLRIVKPDVLAYLCTSCTFILGLEGDQTIVRRIEEAGGAPATTTSTAMVQALHALGAGRNPLLVLGDCLTIALDPAMGFRQLGPQLSDIAFHPAKGLGDFWV